MTFSPLPKTFLDDLRHRRDGRVVELGSGDGAFTEVLRAEGCVPVTVDRWRGYIAGGEAVQSKADIVADAVQPPLRPASLDFLVAANLLRHLWPMPARAAVPAAWFDLLKPTGTLYILEDEPVGRPAPARLYRDLQAFLARLLPESRGPLLPLAVFRAGLESGTGIEGCWRFGSATNAWPASRAGVLAWLRRPDARADGEAARLAADIAREGLSYGDFWWARWTRSP